VADTRDLGANRASAAHASGRARLLRSISGAPGRFDAFVERLCTWLALPEREVRELLRCVDDPSAWRPSATPGHATIRLRSSRRNERLTLARIDVGATFLAHAHPTDELVFCLAGGADQLNGAYLDAGDVDVTPAGNRHGCRNVGSVPCILLLRRPIEG